MLRLVYDFNMTVVLCCLLMFLFYLLVEIKQNSIDSTNCSVYTLPLILNNARKDYAKSLKTHE